MPNDPNFLQDIPIPQLGSGFSTQFSAFCQAVKNNFERLISVQYTKGNDGNSVEAKQLHIDNDLDDNDALTVLGYGLVSTMFGDGSFNSDPNNPHDGLVDTGIYQHPQTKGWILDQLENPSENPDINAKAPVFTFPYAEDPGGHHSIPCILDSNNIGFDLNIVLDEHNGKAYLAVPYVFIDGRIEDLNRYIRNHANINDTYKNFYDFSTVLYGVGTYDHNNQNHDEQHPETWDWKIWRNDIVPKLYFDENVNEFCWQVNGQQTGVTAQGIKGDDGYTPQVQVARGTKTNNIITVNDLQIIDESGQVTYEGRSSTDDPITKTINNVEITSLIWKQDDNNPEKDVVVRNIDFMLVFYNESSPDPINFAFLGRPFISPEGGVSLTCDLSGNDNVFDIIKDQHFRDFLNSIIYTPNYSTDWANIRGIYIPAVSTNDVSAVDKVHMTYSETTNDNNGFTNLHSAPVSMDSTHSYSSAAADPAGSSGNKIGNWQIDYNLDIQGSSNIHGDLSVQGNISTQGDLSVQGNTVMQGNLTVQGNAHMQGNLVIDGQLTATGVDFRPIKDTHLGMASEFTDTKYELKRTNSTTQGIVFKTSLSTNLKLRIGKVSFVQGTQGVQNNEAWSDTNMNTAFHKVLSMFGSVSDGMWADDDNYDAHEDIKNAAKAFTTQDILHNAPKLYDTIEYNIPINISYPVYTGVQQAVQEVVIGSGSDSKYSVQYYRNTDAPDSTVRIKKSGGNRVACGIYQSQGISGNDSFSTPSFRLQQYYYDNVSDSNGNNIEIDRGDLHLEGNVPDSNPTYTFINNVAGSWDALKQKLEYFSRNNNYFHSITGTLDYVDGITINYYIDFFIRIFERAGAATYTNESSSKVNTYLTILPVGFIEVTLNDPDTHNNTKYRAPIYGDVAVRNSLPKTKSGSIFEIQTLNPNIIPNIIPI